MVFLVACPHGFVFNAEKLILRTKRRFKRICYFTDSMKLFTFERELYVFCYKSKN